MLFTPYIPIDATGGSLDPLSFLRPAGQLRDTLFRQFTILSRRPAYHGALCWIFHHLRKKDIHSTQKDFARKFREIELFWGLVNSHPQIARYNLDEAGQSILNITKFETLHANSVTSFAKAKHWGPLFARVNYGTWGHYAGPSRIWGLLDPKGRELTPAGLELALAWGTRGSAPFADLLDAWMNGAPLDESFIDKSRPYALGAPSSPAEKACWHEIINKYATQHPDRKALWSMPPGEDVIALAAREETYAGFFPALIKHYEGCGDLDARVELCGLFDTLAGLAQLAFEWEYARRTFDDKIVPDYPDVEENITAALRPLLDTFRLLCEPQRFTWDLADTLAAVASWDDLAHAVLTHHEYHQQRKRVSPYIREGAIVVHDRIDPASVTALMDVLKKSPESIVSKISWYYRRNWHFSTAALWRRYAGYTA